MNRVTTIILIILGFIIAVSIFIGIIIFMMYAVAAAIGQSRLSRLLGKDPVAISRALNYLESKGYIERRGTNGKTNGIFLTEYANSRKEEIESVADLVTDKATAGMTSHQKDLLKQLLDTIYDNIK